MKSRRAGARLAAVAVVLATVLAVSAVPAGAQEPPPPQPELPVIPPTVCLDHEPETAADYNAFFGGGLGTWQAGDVPHRYPLPDGRVLWLLNDSFLSPVDPAGPLTADSGLVHNAAFVQAGTCVTALATLDADHHPQPFLPDPAPGQWYWPLGGVVQGDSLPQPAAVKARLACCGWRPVRAGGGPVEVPGHSLPRSCAPGPWGLQTAT